MVRNLIGLGGNERFFNLPETLFPDDLDKQDLLRGFLSSVAYKHEVPENLLELHDFLETSFSGDAGKIPIVNSSENGLYLSNLTESGLAGVGGISRWVDLNAVPLSQALTGSYATVEFNGYLSYPPDDPLWFTSADPDDLIIPASGTYFSYLRFYGQTWNSAAAYDNVTFRLYNTTSGGIPLTGSVEVRGLASGTPKDIWWTMPSFLVHANKDDVLNVEFKQEDATYEYTLKGVYLDFIYLNPNEPEFFEPNPYVP